MSSMLLSSVSSNTTPQPHITHLKQDTNAPAKLKGSNGNMLEDCYEKFEKTHSVEKNRKGDLLGIKLAFPY